MIYNEYCVSDTCFRKQHVKQDTWISNSFTHNHDFENAIQQFLQFLWYQGGSMISFRVE